jgi:hypothetical protein
MNRFGLLSGGNTRDLLALEPVERENGVSSANVGRVTGP